MTRLERLIRHRDDLERRMEDTSSDHAFAVMSGQYRDTLEQIAGLEAAQDSTEDELDELRKRRDDKRNAG
jgi:hypothetical protein